MDLHDTYIRSANSKLESSHYSLLVLDKKNLLEFSLHWSTYLYMLLLVINYSFLLTHFHYSFPFNFFFCSIYSMGKYMSCHVTEGMTMSHQRSCHMSHHALFGQECRIVDVQTIGNMYK